MNNDLEFENLAAIYLLFWWNYILTNKTDTYTCNHFLLTYLFLFLRNYKKFKWEKENAKCMECGSFFINFVHKKKYLYTPLVTPYSIFDC